MAGAFGALGGDLSALSINPAASSVFLHSELGGTVSFLNNATTGTYFGNSILHENQNLDFDQIGFASVFNNNNTESNWTRISAGINVHHIANFNQKSRLDGTSNQGIDNYFLYYASGLAFQHLPLYDDETVSEIYSYLSENIGYGAQQAFLGYQAYLLNPSAFDDNNTDYYSNVEFNQLNHKLDLINKGKHRKTTFNFGVLYKNLLHLGVNINYHKLEYQQDHYLFESNQNHDSPVYDINFENKLFTYGEGYSTQLGFILKLKTLRFGFTYDSPKWLSIYDEDQQSLSAYHYEDGNFIKETITPDVINAYTPYRLKMPSKTTFSGAYIFGNKGLLSVDYNYQNAANTTLSEEGRNAYLDTINTEIKTSYQPIQTLKIGGEYRFNNISLRAGYLQQNSPSKSLNKENQAITFGLGFDFGSSSLNLSFVRSEQNQQFNLYPEGLTTPYDLSKASTLVGLSYNLKL